MPQSRKSKHQTVKVESILLHQTRLSAVVTPSGGRSDETYGGLSHSSAPAIASGM